MSYKSSRLSLARYIAAAVLAIPVAAQASMQNVHYFQSGSSDGASPQASLVTDGAGNLYGTTYVGGASGLGTVFEITIGGAYAMLYSFRGGSDGQLPQAGLMVDNKGNLYGTTYFGGASGLGTVFKVAPGGKESVLYNFQNGNGGGNPKGGVIMDAQGNLYGTTEGGGSKGLGTVYKLTPSGTETVLHAFQGLNDGEFPSAGLVADAAGNMYGTTGNGGPTGDGVIFKVTPGGSETVLYSFKGLLHGDGTDPAGLITDSNGNLYGTTSFGGASRYGTVFKLTPGGTETVLYSFKGGTDGENPNAGLVIDASGNLYGTTSVAGAGNCGTVFQVTPGRTETVLQAFVNGVSGCDPHGGLVLDQNLLYGTTYGNGPGRAPYGTVFRTSK